MRDGHLLRFLAVLLVGLLGCDKVVAAGGVNQSQPRQYIVLVDLSESRSPDVLREDQHFLNDVIQNLNFGDHFVLIQMQQLGLADRPRRWEVPMPTPKDPSYPTAHDRQRLQSAQKGLVFEMPSFFQSRDSAKVLHTDIFTTLAVASEFARDSRGKPTTLVLLSDMLQSAKGVEMEHLSRMPPPHWVEDQKRMGLLPQLSGACVAVVGADATTREGITVRNFWQRYFAAAGAPLDPRRYRVLPPAAVTNLCS